MDLNIKSFAEYIPLALRTEAPPPGDYYPDYRLLHACMGFTTELGELREALDVTEEAYDQVDMVNVWEEIGDLCWYAAIASDASELEPYQYPHFMKLDSPQPDIQELILSVDAMFVVLGTLMDVLKRRIYYGATDDNPKSSIKTFTSDLNHFLHNLYVLIYHSGKDTKEILESNIRKLAARYPDKFTTEKALNRDVENEYRAMGETK